jgi:hypothetical protein
MQQPSSASSAGLMVITLTVTAASAKASMRPKSFLMVCPVGAQELRWVQSTDALLRVTLLRVHDSHRGGEEGEEDEYLFHDTICAMTVVTAMPVVNAKVSAKTRKIFFMAVAPLHQ